MKFADRGTQMTRASERFSAVEVGEPAKTGKTSRTKGSTASRLGGTIVTATVKQRIISFFVADRDDAIQRRHAEGCFYEEEELEIISSHFAPGGVFVDIGANVGNHSVYVGKYLYPRQVVVIEPVERAASILKVNILLNSLQSVVDGAHLGVGFADVIGTANPETPVGNLGGTRLIRSRNEQGSVALVRGDSIMRDRRVDFIKIDVEGMELQVLAGLRETIGRWRPAMFIEVDNSNSVCFQKWLHAHGYAIAGQYRRYEVNENYMILPIEACARAARKRGKSTR